MTDTWSIVRRALLEQTKDQELASQVAKSLPPEDNKQGDAGTNFLSLWTLFTVAIMTNNH